MPWDGSGNFSLVENFPADRDLGRPHSLIDADKFQTELTNIKEGIENALARDGQNEPLDNIPMGGYTFTGMRAAVSNDEPVIASQLVAGAFDWVGVPSGTANALTVTLTFSVTLASGSRLKGIAGANNTGAGTISLNGAAAKSILRADGSALRKNDLRAGEPFSLIYNGTAFLLESPLTVDGRGIPTFALASATVTGSAIAGVSPSTFQTLAAGQAFVMTPDANAGATPTLAIDGGTAYPIQTSGGNALGASQIAGGTTYILYFTGTAFRITSSTAAISVTSELLADLGDVSAPTPSTGDTLKYNSVSGAWENAQLAVSELADVDLTGVTTGDVLRYVAGEWVAGSVSDALGYVPLDSAYLTGGNVLSLVLSVDGAGSLLDADLLDGQQGAYYTDIAARLGYTPLNAATYTAADVLSKLLTVDGAASGVDADLLDGQQGSYYTDIVARLGYTPTNKAGDTMTGVLGLPVGSLSATSLFFTGDANTGLYSPAADKVSLVAGGVNRLTATAAGIGIGVTDPTVTMEFPANAQVGFRGPSGLTNGSAGTSMQKNSDGNFYFDNYDGSILFRHASYVDSLILASNGNVAVRLGSTPSEALHVGGNIRSTGFIRSGSYFQGATYLVSTLPSGLSAGSQAVITDYSSGAYGSVPTGGGSGHRQVIYTGSNWQVS
jgi:hypothetical protein